MKHKYFKNITSTSADFYVYGDIVDEKEADFWTGEVSKTEVDTLDMQEELSNLQGITDLNIYINSAGGSIFASSTIVSMLNRFRDKTGAKIHGFIDGLCASAATYLLMVADDINVYKNSIMMIHKPMTISVGNANDLQKDIDTLNTIENDMMIPMYLNKSKVDEKELKNLINEETWFNANGKDKNFIGNFFAVNLLDEAKEVTACVSKELFKNYKNVPETFNKMFHEEHSQTKPKQQKNVVENKSQNIDYSYFENKLKEIKK